MQSLTANTLQEVVKHHKQSSDPNIRRDAEIMEKYVLLGKDVVIKDYKSRVRVKKPRAMRSKAGKRA